MIKTAARRDKALAWFVFLFVASLAVRVFFIIISEPGIENDSPGYITLAHQLASLNLTGDNGFRTPVYPLFIALFDFNPVLIRFGQTVLGLLILSMLFWTAWHFTGHPVISFFCGALYGFNLAQIYFESKVLTETLTTFLVVACLLIFIRLPEIYKRSRFKPWVLAVGVLSAVAALTRPLFLFLPPLLSAILFLRLSDKTRLDQLRVAGLLFLPALILVGSWSLFNYFRLGYFGPSTFTGLGLADHSITFIQFAPDQYAAIRAVYMNLRAQEGTNAVNIWDGFAQIQSATGESFVQLSKTLAQMSTYLIIRHPFLYLESVAVTWIRFWNEPGWWTWPAIHSPALQLGVAYAWRAEKYFLVFFLNLPFLLITAISSARVLAKRSWALVWQNFHWLTLSIVVLVTSVVQAMVERGDVPRYAIPVQPLATVVLALGLLQIWNHRKKAQLPLS